LISCSSLSTSALSFFAPQVIGGAIGALFEGTEGAIGGIEASGKLRDDYNAQKEMERKALLEQERMDLAKISEARRSGNTGLEMMRIEQAAERLNLSKMQFMKDLKEAERREQFASQLSEKQVSQITEFNSTIAGLKNISDLKNKVSTGILVGRGQSMLEKAGLASTDFTTLAGEVEATRSSFMKAISGAQVAEAEARRLARVIPSVNDHDDVFTAKLNAFNNIVNRHKDSLLEAIQTGQPLRKEIAAQMQAEVDAALRAMPGGSSPKTPPTGASPRVNTNDLQKLAQEELNRRKNK
jgi:hypothetical protein